MTTQHRITATGQRFSHEVHPPRLSESRNAGRWPTLWDRLRSLAEDARAIGEPSITLGALIVGGGLLVVGAVVALAACLS